MNEYKPKFRENVKEIGNVIKDAFKKGVYNPAICTGKTIGAIGKGIGEGVFYGIMAIQTLPTLCRLAEEDISKNPLFEDKCSFYDAIRGAVGIITCLGTVGSLCGLYVTISCNEKIMNETHPEILLIPVATNVLSGLYEIARHRLIKKKSLEDKVE